LFLAKLAQEELLSYKTKKERPFKKMYTLTNKGNKDIKEVLNIKNY
jgi:DNA-binding PadR family transcriptional regulator